jgi:hypothetical protein
MWWCMSTTMRLAHTPEPDTIAPLPVRWQRCSKGLEMVEADRASTTMHLAHTLELDTLAGGTPVRMYRQTGSTSHCQMRRPLLAVALLGYDKVP